MKSYTVRVQLNGYPDAEDYDTLHREMRKRGFLKLVQNSTNQKWYHLPHAEYARWTTKSRDEVRAEAAAAAQKVSSDFEILVTESAGRCWQGLRPATDAEVKEERAGA